MAAFEMTLSNPIRSGGRTRNYGGPGVGGHSFDREWYEAYGMDLGAPGGTPVFSAFDGHVTRLNLGNIDKTSGKQFGAELFVRGPNDLMGAFYTHFRELPPGLAVGSEVPRGQFLGTLVPVADSPHVHFALVEIVDTAYHGVDLYSWFDRTVGTEEECMVTFRQDGTNPAVGGQGQSPDPGLINLGTVRGVQQALTSLGYDPGSADGVSGTRTEAAVRAFQSDNVLTADGIAGPMTKEALGAALTAAGIAFTPA